MPYLLGCDFGGSSAKATLLSVTGQVVATASAEYPTHYPNTKDKSSGQSRLPI